MVVSIRGKWEFNGETVYNDVIEGCLVSVNEQDSTTIEHDGETFPVLIATNVARWGSLLYQWLSPLEQRYADLGIYWIGGVSKKGFAVHQIGADTLNGIFKVSKMSRIYTYEQFQMYLVDQEREFQKKISMEMV